MRVQTLENGNAETHREVEQRALLALERLTHPDLVEEYWREFTTRVESPVRGSAINEGSGRA